MKSFMLNHRITSQEDVYELLDGHTHQDLLSAFKNLSMRIKKGRNATDQIKYTVFFLFSGHGYLREGS